MISRAGALGGGMLLGGLLVATLWFSSRPRACEPDARADILLGGGLPVCLGRSPAQFEQFGGRVHRDPDSGGWVFPAGDLRFWYEVSGGVNVLVGHVGERVRGACVEVRSPDQRDVDSLAAFRRSLLGGHWARMDTVHLGATITTWRRDDGLQLTTSSARIYCGRPALSER